MVQIEVLFLEYSTAILACVLISFENIVPSEFHFFFGQFVEQQKKDHSRNTYLKRDSTNAFGVRLIFGKVLPLSEVKSLKGSIVASRDNLRPAFKEERQCPLSSADIDCLP